jgi:hypothetical protein
VLVFELRSELQVVFVILDTAGNPELSG